MVYSLTLEVLEQYGVARRLAALGIRARRFTIRDRDQVLMVVPFDRLLTAFPFALLVSVPFLDGTFKIVTSADEAPMDPDVDFVQGQLDAPRSAS